MTKLKKDQYFKNRKGFSQVYQLYCNKCSKPLVRYQKDGPGPLLRLYVDRMQEQSYTKNFKENQFLTCSSCQRKLAVGYVYEKENRSAYRVFQNAIGKKPVSQKANLYFWLANILKR